MEQPPRDAGSDIPKLLGFAEGLSSDAARLQQRVPLNADSADFSLCFMAACFVSREVDHLRGVANLTRIGLDSEALILARSMLEGMVQLLWAAQEPDVRPSMWHRFVFVEDWRITQRREEPLSEREEEERSLLNEKVREDAADFLTPRAQKAERAGQQMPSDPYRQKWYGAEPVRELFKQTSAEDLWPLYRVASESVHWTMRGLGSSIERDDTKLTYRSEDPKKAATALTSGIQAVLQAAQVLASCLGEDARKSVADWYGNYVSLMRKGIAAKS